MPQAIALALLYLDQYQEYFGLCFPSSVACQSFSVSPTSQQVLYTVDINSSYRIISLIFQDMHKLNENNYNRRLTKYIYIYML